MTSWLNLFVDITCIVFVYYIELYCYYEQFIVLSRREPFLVCVNKRYFILRRGVLSRYGFTPRIIL